MSYASSFDWNVICEVCRKKTKASMLRKRWDGLLVCEEDYEERHPLDYPRPPYHDDRPLPFTRPEEEDTFIEVCTPQGRLGVAGYGTAGCAITGLTGLGIFPDIPSGTFNSSTL